MILKNAKILRGETNRFDRETMTVKNGLITSFEATDDSDSLDCEGLYVLPGMIDTHIHGYVGVEFAKDDGDFQPAQEVLARDGVTGFACTVRCMPIESILSAMRNVARQINTPQKGARVLGIHSEGPFVSEVRRGAMHPPAVTCGIEPVQQMLQAADGLLKLMTIAPEREHAAEVIAFAAAHGVHCSLGHTDATYAVAEAAVEAGADRITHIFNAMRPLSHRETGILGAALTDDRLHCELIADFVHLDPAAVQLVYRAKGANRITLISDAGKMSGLPNGEYEVGGIVRTVRDGLCLDPEGRIAGSCYSMLKGAQNLRSLGVPLEEIALMASRNPAEALSVLDRVGTLEVGKAADFLLCDKDFHLHAVFIGGERVK